MRVLVTGATDRYGRVTARTLAAEGYEVRALVPETDGPTARGLRTRGVDLVRGRRDQLDHVEDALDDADALFLATGARTAREETEQGETLVRAAGRSDLTVVVHASVLNADARPGIPTVDVRADVESALCDLEVPHVSLRTGVPLDAFERVRTGVETADRLSFPLEGRARAAFTDPLDVGRAAAAVFADPTRLRARADADANVDVDVTRSTELAVTSGTHSLYDVADALGTLLGRSIRADPCAPTNAPPARRAFYRWVNEGALLGTGERAFSEVYDVEPSAAGAYFERAGWA